MQAVTRELFEELGVTGGTLKAGQGAEIPEGVITVFTLHHWEGEPANTAPDEHDAIAWFTADETETLRLADERLATLIRRELTAAMEHQQS